VYENRDVYPELLYAIAADRVRAMRDEQAAWQARRARRQRWVLRVRATLRDRLARSRTRRGGGTS
jgi:hypothetical protein